ncbi:MAG: hypothetical protein ACYTF1_27280 [Planctomycetota bacterium]
MSVRIGRIGYVACLECGFHGEHYINYENPETQKCSQCGEPLIESGWSKRKAILPGGFANSPDEELYIRPDKDNPAREWFRQGMAWEQLEQEGKTKPLDDWDGRKAQIKSWEQAGYEL